jgi:hypothetical protein
MRISAIAAVLLMALNGCAPVIMGLSAAASASTLGVNEFHCSLVTLGECALPQRLHLPLLGDLYP